MTGRWFHGGTLAIATLAGLVGAFGAARVLAGPPASCKDGLAVGAWGEDGGASAMNLGVVHYVHQGTGALTAYGSQVFQQWNLGGLAEPFDNFGWVLASGDFDGDGCADLAIGVPYENSPTTGDVGEVDIAYGGADGLDLSRGQILDQALLGLSPEYEDRFGAALAVGDFDGDGYDDLAIGVPEEDVGTIANAGGFHVVYGSATGLSPTGAQWFDQGVLGLFLEAGDGLATALAAGDFDGDGYDDLAAGTPYEDIGPAPATVIDAGGFSVLYGGASGLSVAGVQWIDQGLLGLSVEAGDRFGYHLATGDFDGDGYDDLSVGAPYEDIGVIEDAGGVSIVYGGAAGLLSGGSQWFDQNGLGRWAEAGDHFGWWLATGDLDGDRCDDLAVGVPHEDVALWVDGGEVDVVYGGPSGLSGTGSVYFDQDWLGLTVEDGDGLGEVVAVGDMNRDGFADLAIGVPHEHIGTLRDAGGVHVLYGGPGGVTTTGAQWFDQDTPGLNQSAGEFDLFGASLSVLESTLVFRDGFESGATGSWSASLP